MSITPELAFSWVGIAALVLSVLIGAMLITGGFGKFLYRATVTMAFVSGLALLFLVGVVLITSPKWTEIVLKFKDMELTIAALEKKNDDLHSKLVFAEAKNNLKNYINTGNVVVWKPAQTDTLAENLVEALQKVDPSVAPSKQAVTQAVGLLSRQGYAAYKKADQKPDAAQDAGLYLLGGINVQGWKTLEAQGIINQSLPK